MKSTVKKENQARKLCTHTVVFVDPTDVAVVMRSLQGRTTRAIAREFSMTEAQVQYRISKAQKSIKARFRADYRNGSSELSQQMLAATDKFARVVVQDKVAPKFAALARPGVLRH